MTKPTAAANGAAFPKSQTGPYGPMSCGIDWPALRKMSLLELSNPRSVLRTLCDVTSGLCCQPRFFAEEKMRFNDAGSILEEIAEFLSAYEQAIVDVAKAARPIASEDVRHRAWTLLGYEAALAGGGLASFAVLAAEAVRDEGEAEFQERHVAGQ